MSDPLLQLTSDSVVDRFILRKLIEHGPWSMLMDAYRVGAVVDRLAELSGKPELTIAELAEAVTAHDNQLRRFELRIIVMVSHRLTLFARINTP